MGAGNSAIASNTSYLKEGIFMSDTEDCSAATVQVIDSSGSNQAIGKIIAGGNVIIGSNIAKQSVSCKNGITAIASAKALLMQDATATAKGAATGSSSKVSSYSDLQERIVQTITARCSASVNQSIKHEVYPPIEEIVCGKDCIIGSNVSEQTFTCMNSIIANATASAQVTQTTTSTASGTSWLQTLEYIVGGILALVILVFLGKEFWSGSSASKDPRVIDPRVIVIHDKPGAPGDDDDTEAP